MGAKSQRLSLNVSCIPGRHPYLSELTVPVTPKSFYTIDVARIRGTEFLRAPLVRSEARFHDPGEVRRGGEDMGRRFARPPKSVSGGAVEPFKP
jgi:hypothetical protein